VGDERIEEVVREIEADLARRWQNPDLARIAHMATNAFIRRFGQVMRTSPLRYVASRRLDQARILLEHTDGTIEAIADECGFCSRSHLSTTFQKQFGVGPAKYRRATRQM
jgi:transcriptional regulator GlxA family with amidase domain